jgi:hypothetical protein
MNPLGSLLDLVPGVVPQDIDLGPLTGDFVSLKNAEGVLIVFFKAAGVANDDPTLELQQATSVAAGGVKDLDGFVDIYRKQGAALTGVGTWTKVTQGADEDFVGNATSAEEQGIYAAWVPADMLDRDGGFDCLQVNIKDPGAAGAQMGCVLYILVGLRYQRSPENALSAIVD